jgi:hypothetical protein
MSQVTLTADSATYGSGSFWAFNNVWGKGSLVNGVDYTQSISFVDSTFPDGITMSWNWPVTPSVLAYPEVIYGTSPYTPTPSGVTALPPSTQVADFANLSTQYSFSIAGQTNHFDVTFDMWLTSQPNGGRATVEDELMIVVHNPWGWGPDGSPNFTTGGITVWESGTQSNSSGTQSWTLLSAVSSTDMLSGTISISNVLKGLIWNGSLTGNEYISGVEVGAEVNGGVGSLTINNLSYQWNANPTVTLAAGDDTYSIATPGGNHILGNGGVDTVVYQGAYSQYQIEQSGTETLVQQSGNISTLDVLNGIAFVEFSDGTYNVATSTFASNVAPTVSSVAASGSGITNGSGDLNAGHVVTLTLTMSEAVTVAGGTPTLTLNDGGTATYTGGSGTTALTFSYTVAAGQNTPDLAVTAVNLGAATVIDAAGNADLAGAVTTFSGLQIDTTAPAAPVIATDTINANNSVALTGTAVANGMVTVYDGTTSLGTTTANASGAWSYTTGTLANGSQVFTATATDTAGNTSAASNSIDLVISQPDHWTKTVSANWSTAADWSSGVPASSDLVALDAVGKKAYTVTSAANETIAEFNTVSKATLAIAGGTFTITDGTGAGVQAGTVSIANGAMLEISSTFDNSGTIALNSAGAATDLTIAGGATLSGTGKVTLSNNVGNAVISNGVAAILTNVGNTISGAGTIGDSYLTLVNQGTINANQTNALVVNTGGNTVTNSGTLAATSSGGLDIESNVSNSETIEALGTNAKVVIEGVITNAATGLILASGSGAQVDLDGATIVGGTLQTSGGSAFIETVSGSADWLNGGTISSGSTVEINSGTTLTIGGTVNNSGTLLVNGGTLNIDGVLTGGNADIGGIGSVVIAQASGENIAFLAGSTGKLVLESTSYTGEVSGFGTNTSQSIDLTDLDFAAGVEVSYVPNSGNTAGVLTVTDGTKTAYLQLGGIYSLANFTVASDGNGGTLITDPKIVEQKPGNASASIASGTVLEINTPDSGTVTFAGSAGTLWLDQPSTFTGKVSGFGARDVIDLPGIAFGADTTLGYLPNSKQTGGTLSITNGTHSANIALLGNYMASSFVMESDNHGGTMVVAEASQTSNHTLLTTAQHA